MTASRSNSSVGTSLPPKFTEATFPVVLLNLIFIASDFFSVVPSRIRSSPSAFQEPIILPSSDLLNLHLAHNLDHTRISLLGLAMKSQIMPPACVETGFE